MDDYDITYGFDVVMGEWVFHAVHKTDPNKWSMGSLFGESEEEFLSALEVMLQETEG